MLSKSAKRKRNAVAIISVIILLAGVLAPVIAAIFVR